jgi:Holliday junction DNA helicase RuvA
LASWLHTRQDARMISYLIGKPILEKDSVTILCHGVGYGVRVSERLRAKLFSQIEAEIFIHTHVREEALDLYGFENHAERDLFLLLLSVSGVGPKTALALLNYDPSQIIDAVQQANTTFFSAVPRVGKKLAQKIIIELRSKLGALKELEIGPLSPKLQEVTLALQSLGFDESSIHDALQSLNLEELQVGEAVKQALRHLTQKSSAA